MILVTIKKPPKKLKVLDNSIERAAQMVAGNTAGAFIPAGSNADTDERLQRLETRFSSLESKIDRLLARSLNTGRSTIAAGPGAPARAPAAAGAPAFSFASLLTPKETVDTSKLEA